MHYIKLTDIMPAPRIPLHSLDIGSTRSKHGDLNISTGVIVRSIIIIIIIIHCVSKKVHPFGFYYNQVRC